MIVHGGITYKTGLPVNLCASSALKEKASPDTPMATTTAASEITVICAGDVICLGDDGVILKIHATRLLQRKIINRQLAGGKKHDQTYRKLL